jgi:Ca2+-binding RTX toxin-like protein
LGGDGDDTLRGGAGDDYIEGGAGNDLIDDGAGNDRIVSPTSSDNWITGPGGNTVQTTTITPTFAKSAAGRTGTGMVPRRFADDAELQAELVDLVLR